MTVKDMRWLAAGILEQYGLTRDSIARPWPDPQGEALREILDLLDRHAEAKP